MAKPPQIWIDGMHDALNAFNKPRKGKDSYSYEVSVNEEFNAVDFIYSNFHNFKMWSMPFEDFKMSSHPEELTERQRSIIKRFMKKVVEEIKHNDCFHPWHANPSLLKKPKDYIRGVVEVHGGMHTIPALMQNWLEEADND